MAEGLGTYILGSSRVLMAGRGEQDVRGEERLRLVFVEGEGGIIMLLSVHCLNYNS